MHVVIHSFCIVSHLKYLGHERKGTLEFVINNCSDKLLHANIEVTWQTRLVEYLHLNSGFSKAGV